MARQRERLVDVEESMAAGVRYFSKGTSAAAPSTDELVRRGANVGVPRVTSERRARDHAIHETAFESIDDVVSRAEVGVYGKMRFAAFELDEGGDEPREPELESRADLQPHLNRGRFPHRADAGFDRGERLRRKSAALHPGP
jgi:hypothetical protein